MSKKNTRRSEIDRRRVRKTKLAMMRKRLAAARTDDEKAKVKQKFRKTAPWLSPEKLSS